MPDEAAALTVCDHAAYGLNMCHLERNVVDACGYKHIYHVPGVGFQPPSVPHLPSVTPCPCTSISTAYVCLALT